MSRKVKIVKKNPEPARGTVGVNPSDPWSSKANIAEASLDTYLLSRGINPKFVSKDTKISHAKSTVFQKWKTDHKFEDVQQEEVENIEEDALLDRYLSAHGINPKYAPKNLKISHSKSQQFQMWKRQHINEEVDKEDVLSFDIPLFIRILELAREDVKEDMELHRITERLLSIRKKGTLTMDDYEFIAGLKKLKEELETIAEGRMKGIATNAAETKRLNKMTTLQKFRADAAAREKKHADIEKNLSKDGSGMSAAIDRLEKHLNREGVEQIDEVNYDTVKSLYTKRREMRDGPSKKAKEVKIQNVKTSISRLSGFKSTQNQPFDKVDKGTHYELVPKKPTTENTLDPLAATEAPSDGANGGDDSSERKRQLSKSARMIKALYKKHNMKEEMYDWEKDDKNQTSPGRKKPKLDKSSDESNFGSNKPQARAVMSGGKTMTNEPRDVVEIDPLMKNRPDLNGNTKDVTDKKINKINN
jgi:hypothetical protein